MSTIKQISASRIIPTFAVVDKDGNRVETLEHCFIQQQFINVDQLDSSIKAKNGEFYEAIYNELILPKESGIKKLTMLRVIISYQKHTYGKFAVIRNYKQGK